MAAKLDALNYHTYSFFRLDDGTRIYVQPEHPGSNFNGGWVGWHLWGPKLAQWGRQQGTGGMWVKRQGSGCHSAPAMRNRLRAHALAHMVRPTLQASTTSLPGATPTCPARLSGSPSGELIGQLPGTVAPVLRQHGLVPPP